MNASNNRASDQPTGTIKLIGIGQSLHGDDAAGLAAVRLWQSTYAGQARQAEVQVELAELPGITLLNLMQGCRLVILVDAMRSDAEAGTVRVISDEQLEAFSSGTGSAHGWGVAETLALGKQLAPSEMPAKLVLIGIEAGGLTMGESLSVAVTQALPEVTRLINQVLDEGNPTI